MKSKFLTSVENRRTLYALSAESSISNARIEEILETAIKHSPSAFNSQSSRVVLLKGTEHKALWDIVLEALRAIVPPEAFEGTKKKVASFAAAYATILFFEEQETITNMQKQFPAYADNFPLWSMQASGMLQFIIWTALEDEGMGASLQHYNPLVDDKIKEKWNIPSSWKLIAQMPFGKPAAPAEEKKFLPKEERIRIFG